jgi:hypothetical protein
VKNNISDLFMACDPIMPKLMIRMVKLGFCQYLFETQESMSKKISPSLLEAAIVAEVKTIKRKEEIYEELKKFNAELASMKLNEVGMVGSFGFATPQDAAVKNGTTTGFAAPQQLSHVKELMDEFKEEEPKPSPSESDMQALKEENTTLKNELEALKKQLAPAA